MDIYIRAIEYGIGGALLVVMGIVIGAIAHVKVVIDDKKRLDRNIVSLRKWLNEKPANIVVTDEHIKYWLDLN